MTERFRLTLVLASMMASMSALSPTRATANQTQPAPGGSSTATPQAGDTTKSQHGTETLARDVVNDLASRNFEKVEARYSARVAQALPHGKLAEVWDQLAAQVGSFKSIRTVGLGEAEGSRLAKVTCEFERATLDIKLAFDGEDHIAGLFFAPAESAASPWTPPDYVHQGSFEERAVTVGQGPVKLTGTLALPKGEASFPAVVLVQGSGATDQDEGVGPNKPFKDVAWGLASQGIAVLRYNKRTFQYPGSFKGDFTVEQETVQDARAGVHASGWPSRN